MPKLTVLRSFQGNGSLIIATKSMRSSGRAMIFYSGIGISLLISSLSVGEAFVLSRKQSKSACNCFQLYSLSSEEESPERQLKKAVKPDILKPFLPAADPNYMNEGPVGENDFILSRDGEPKELELSNENLLRILRVECSDLEVNTLVWKCLGYRFDPHANLWNNDKCFPKWKEKYPTPPDLIGMQRIYSPEIDKPSLRANQAIVRSIPVDNKQSLKTHLKPYGFTGYQFAELTPNKTRRAQCANWLLYFREELFGFTVEELRKRRQAKKEAGEGQGDEWKPPVREVF